MQTQTPGPMPNALLERDRELGAVARLLDRARVGDGSTLMLQGPAGIGKTAVLRAATTLEETATLATT